MHTFPKNKLYLKKRIITLLGLIYYNICIVLLYGFLVWQSGRPWIGDGSRYESKMFLVWMNFMAALLPS